VIYLCFWSAIIIAMDTHSRLFATLGVFLLTLLLLAQLDMNVARQVRLFNGWGLSPAGDAIELPGDMPARILVSPDSKYLIVNTTGFNEHGPPQRPRTVVKRRRNCTLPKGSLNPLPSNG
jgi:hypothetical protein